MVTAMQVKELRERTGAGLMDCKRALSEVAGDLDRAVELLRVRGEVKAGDRAGREVAEGTVGVYIHPGSQQVAMVEVNCETDFVARTADLQEFAREVAMQVVASRPEYVERGEVPPEVVERERSILQAQAREEGRPESVLERVVEGRLERFFREKVLVEQPLVRDPERTVGEYLAEVSSRTGERVVIRRFTRYQVGA